MITVKLIPTRHILIRKGDIYDINDDKWYQIIAQYNIGNNRIYRAESAQFYGDVPSDEAFKSIEHHIKCSHPELKFSFDRQLEFK